MNQVIGYLGKLDGWEAGKSHRTYHDLATDTLNLPAKKSRKMIVPAEPAMVDAAKAAGSNLTEQADLNQQPGEKKAKWLTRGHFAFEKVASGKAAFEKSKGAF